jgi:hypothetical protein
VVGLIFFLIILVMLLVFFIVTWFSNIQIELLFKREAQNDFGKIKVNMFGGLLRFQYYLPRIQWSGLDEGVVARKNVTGKIGKAKTKPKKESVQIDKRKIKKLHFAYRQILYRFHDFQRIMRWFFGKITCEKFVWNTKIGTGDAAEAGILTGLAWSIKWMLLSWLGNQIRWNAKPELKVDPRFNEAILETYFHSIIRFRIGHAILAVKRLSDHMRKGRIQ